MQLWFSKILMIENPFVKKGWKYFSSFYLLFSFIFLILRGTLKWLAVDETMQMMINEIFYWVYSIYSLLIIGIHIIY